MCMCRDNQLGIVWMDVMTCIVRELQQICNKCSVTISMDSWMVGDWWSSLSLEVITGYNQEA